MAEGGFERQMSRTTPKWMSQVQDAEVLILYQGEDQYMVSKLVLEHFRKRNVRYIHPEEHFTPGEINIRMTSDAIEHCEKLLLIVSNFKQTHFSLEYLLALEKCQRRNCLNLILLVMGEYDSRDLPKVPMMKNATIVKLDYNVQERCLDEVIRHIRRKSFTISDTIHKPYTVDDLIFVRYQFRGFRGGSDTQNLVPTKKRFSVYIMATNFEPHDCVIFAQSMKIGTH